MSSSSIHHRQRNGGSKSPSAVDDCSSTDESINTSMSDSSTSSHTGNGSFGTSSIPLTKKSRSFQRKAHDGIFIPFRVSLPLLALIIGGCVYCYFRFDESIRRNQWFQRHHYPHDSHISINTLRGMSSSLKTNTDASDNQCRWYLAESAIPKSGLGIFTAMSLHKGDMVGYPDVCIFVSNPPDHWTHLRSHTFGRGSFFGQYEGRKSRAACEGLITTANTVPDEMVNMEMISPVLATNGGLHRATSPGAGATTHHYGIHGQALDIISAGSEITINYGDWGFRDSDYDTVYRQKPSREVSWLKQYGWCIDNIRIEVSSIPNAGRGAFARFPLSRGSVVAPAPLQIFQHRYIFQSTNPEQLYINYCLQPAESDMVVFPYGQGVNLINHSYKQPNVEWRWSTHANHMHHAQWLDLSYDEFWKIVSPGSLILEVVALRDIEEGEEILINYGQSWEEAWQQHVRNWQPLLNSTTYVYPSEMDETETLRTMKEQVTNPYPGNLITMCLTGDYDRAESKHSEWREPKDYTWSEGMTYCHILDRKYDRKRGDYLYTVSLIFSFNAEDFAYDATIPTSELFIDYHVPRRAIRFVEIPYMDDEHLSNAFRHPMELPSQLVPESWKHNHNASYVYMEASE